MDQACRARVDTVDRPSGRVVAVDCSQWDWAWVAGCCNLGSAVAADAHNQDAWVVDAQRTSG
ncbi:hypothetical protein RS3R2_17600 [Pseudomonas lactis]|nr:hypothetical protein RS3R2_17600 [Pseudomonas lactis]